MDTQIVLNKFLQRQHLTRQEAHAFLNNMMTDSVSPSQIGALLTALRMKGETVDEITGLIEAMRENMLRVKANNAIDVCGTGGDGSGTFNISTTVGFVVAGAGVPVAKHGNRAASSASGSADVLEALGVSIILTPEQAEQVLKKTGIVFLFAPLYHPATKQVAIVRKELKIRTIFNVLGPFANPASVRRQIIGVPNKKIAEQLAQVAKLLHYKHLLIVTSNDGLDEISINSPSQIYEIKEKIITVYTVHPAKYGFKKYQQEDIKGGTAQENAQIVLDILRGQKGPKRDVVVLNSAFALYAAGAVSDIETGIQQAERSLDSGSAKKVLENLIKESKKIANVYEK